MSDHIAHSCFYCGSFLHFEEKCPSKDINNQRRNGDVYQMKINLGCGMNYREGYLNVDAVELGSDGKPIKIDIKANILDGLPFKDESCDEVFFSDTLEHLNRHNSVIALKEVYRILKDGGFLDLSVPPAKKQMLQLLLWMDKPVTWDDFVNAHSKFTYFKWMDDLAGASHESDGYDFDSHKSFWSPNALRAVLEHIGFKVRSIDSNIFVKAFK